MSRATSKSLEEIVREARTLAPERQLLFIREACATDEALYEQVLISLGSSADDDADVDHAAAIGDVIDHYRIVRCLGRGGMGEVFLAERADDQFRQQVAIKFVRGGLLSRQAQGRLKLERQILATLDHPNIARLLDGGTTKDGVPYIVMEYVDGEPIDVYCDRHRLSVEERLRLFITVCSAVHRAHQNLVVHRDLKPSNILVTRDGTPKLLDFGIAKLLDERDTLHTVAVTRADYRMLTPDHASPEQVRGEPITTASDIYVLGVLLYELLSGFKPFATRAKGMAELERQICEFMPPSPSEAVRSGRDADGAAIDEIASVRSTTPSKLRRELAGDLDNIVQMAMRKEPERRYASVEQFASDIEQHLAGQPVMARADAWSYRAGKFIRRHALVTALSSAFVVALIAFSINTYVQSLRIRDERDNATAAQARAEAERERAEAVSEFLINAFSLADPSKARGKEITAREILDSGAAHVEKELSAQPDLQATLLDTIARVYLRLGDLSSSEKLSTRSLDITRSLTGPRSLETASRLCSLGETQFLKGEFSLAELSLRECLDIRTALLGSRHPDITPPLDILAGLAMERGDFSEAEKLYRTVLSIDLDVHGAEHPQYARHLQNLATVLHEKGALEEAEPMYREAVARLERALGREDPETIDALSNFGHFLMDRGNLAEAEQVHRRVLSLNRKIRGVHAFVGLDLANLGTLSHRQGKLSEAERRYKEALGVYGQTLPPNHGYVAAALTGLGRVLIDEGKGAEAVEVLQRAVAAWSEEYGAQSSRHAAARASLGKAWLMQGQLSEGERALTESYPVLARSSRAVDRQMGEIARGWIEELYRSQNRPEAAAAYFARVDAQAQ